MERRACALLSGVRGWGTRVDAAFGFGGEAGDDRGRTAPGAYTMLIHHAVAACMMPGSAEDTREGCGGGGEERRGCVPLGA